MPIVISIGGRQSSGKSTVSRELGLLAAYVLELSSSATLSGKKREAPKAWTQRDPRDAFPHVPLTVAVHDRNRASAMPYRHTPAYAVRRHEALSSVPRFAAETVGGVLVCDSVTAWYDEACSVWTDEAKAARERAGKSLHSALGPDAFREINTAYWNALGAAQSGPLAVIFVHREGSSVVLTDDYGPVEGASTRFRGQAEAGSDSHIVLTLKGGLRDGNRVTGERRIQVAADAAQLAVGDSNELPQLRGGPEDLAELRRVLWKLLAPSLLWLRKAAAEEAAEWALVSEAADEFPGARRQGERTEAAQLMDQISTLLSAHRLTSTAADVQSLVRPMLTEAIGWGSLTAASEHGASVEVLRRGLELLRVKAPAVAELLAHEAEQKRAPKKSRAADPAAAPVDPFQDIPDQLG